MRNFILCFAVVPAILTSSVTNVASAANLPRYGIFMYSNLCSEKESGDIAGYRALLIRDGDGDRLFWEWGGEGPLEGPAQARLLKIGSDTFEFAVPQSEGDIYKIFNGTIYDQGMYFGSGVHISLPRVTDFSAKMPECSPIKN